MGKKSYVCGRGKEESEFSPKLSDKANKNQKEKTYALVLSKLYHQLITMQFNLIQDYDKT